MFTTKSLSTMVLLTLAMLNPANPTFAQIETKHAKMQIAMPGEFKKETLKIDENLDQFQLVFNQDNGTVIVAHQDSTPVADAQAILQVAQDAIVKVAGGEVLEMTNFKLNGYPARKFRVSMPSIDGEFRVSHIYTGDKFYQVMAVGTSEFSASDAINKMFESATITK